ncbi:hypothetical protein Dimus_004010 [Dionaea muscipula]
MASRKSNRIVDGGKVNVREKSVENIDKRKKVEKKSEVCEKKKRVESKKKAKEVQAEPNVTEPEQQKKEKVPGHMEPRTKKRHDRNANEDDEMLSEMLRKKWEKLFIKRDLVFKTECREFYKNLTVSISWKKEVVKSRVNGVEIKFDGMTLAIILNIPENNGICDYIKEVWEPSRYCNPLEITRKFANDETILEARRVKSVEMKPFHRLL